MPAPMQGCKGSHHGFISACSGRLTTPVLLCLLWQDGQIESFMIVAQRQIAYLEERVREVQRERE